MAKIHLFEAFLNSESIGWITSVTQGKWYICVEI
jgi:hypothetical protein